MVVTDTFPVNKLLEMKFLITVIVTEGVVNPAIDGHVAHVAQIRKHGAAGVDVVKGQIVVVAMTAGWVEGHGQQRRTAPGAMAQDGRHPGRIDDLGAGGFSLREEVRILELEHREW